jgi:hypothetical protein
LYFRRFHPQSSSWNRADREHQLAYYDPRRSIGLRAHKWHAYRAFLWAIGRAPVGPSDKLQLLVHLLRMMYWSRAELLGAPAPRDEELPVPGSAERGRE